MQVLQVLVLAVYSLSVARAQICTGNGIGVGVAAIDNACCLGFGTTASDGSDACCVSGSRTKSKPDSYPLSGSVVYVQVSPCSTIVPVSASDYSSLAWFIGPNAAAAAPSTTPSAAAPTSAKGASSANSPSSTKSANGAAITEGPIWAGAIAGIAGAAALL